MKEPNSTDRDIESKDIKGFPKGQGKKQLRDHFKLIRKEIYPSLNFNLRHNAKYSTKDFLDLVTHTALNHDFTNNGSKTYGFIHPGSPHGDTVLYHIRKHSGRDYLDMFNRANEKIMKIAKKRGVLRGRVDVAIDYTDHLYYGSIDTPMVMGTKPQRGTNHAYKYATINIVETGCRFTLLAIPRTPLSTEKQIVEKLLDHASKIIDIKTVFLDRGFYSRNVITALKKRGLKFLMPAMRNSRIKKIIQNYEAPCVLKHKIGRISRSPSGPKYKNPVEYNLAIVKDSRGEKKVFSTNLEITALNADNLFELYKKRWGIETSYRVKNGFRTRTTSKNYQVRLFFFLFSVCLYNLWILVNAFVEKVIIGKLLKTPYLSAKVFGAILLSGYWDDGG